VKVARFSYEAEGEGKTEPFTGKIRQVNFVIIQLEKSDIHDNRRENPGFGNVYTGIFLVTGR
jgi:hypothetical protein